MNCLLESGNYFEQSEDELCRAYMPRFNRRDADNVTADENGICESIFALFRHSIYLEIFSK